MSSFTAIMQARRGSTRFKDKILKKIMHKPLLYHQIRRLQHSNFLSSIIVATTEEREDKLIKKICDISNTEIFFGETNDVLDRYYNAAKLFKAENIVRITADCPVIDPLIVDKVISEFNKEKVDYLSNCTVRTFPEGMSVEVFTFDALEKAWNDAIWTSEREHVTPYIWKNPSKFRLGVLLNENGNQSDFRLTVDYPKDLILIRHIYKRLFPINPYFGLNEIMRLIHTNPSLKEINEDIVKNEGYLKSIRNDIIIKPHKK